MPRVARVVIPDVPYHLTHRGNNRADIFRNDGERRTYLMLLRKYSEEANLRVLGYCLMSNHVHLVAIPSEKDSLAKGAGVGHMRYAQVFNYRHEQSGHLWEGRYYSCPLDDAHLVTAMRYVERNPVRAGIVKQAWEYLWSSAAAHLGQRDHSGLLDLAAWSEYFSPTAWREMLAGSEDEDEVQALRQHTRAGRPLGSDEFIGRLETSVGRRLRLLPVGRPKNTSKRGQEPFSP